MRGTQPFRLPLPFAMGDLPELNVRTYVVYGDKPGVWFFSLDAGNRLAVSAARFWYNLPYYQAAMSLSKHGDAIHFRSHRTHKGAQLADFDARYRPTGEVSQPRPHSLEHWLTERYCLYSVDGRGTIYRGENQHVSGVSERFSGAHIYTAADSAVAGNP